MAKNQLAPDHIKEVLKLHERIGNAFRNSLTDAIRIGEILTKQKKACKHGEFLPWIEENFPFNQKAAQNYMKVYVRREEVQALPDMTSAYRLLGMRKQPVQEANAPFEEVASEPESRTKGSNTSLGTHLNPVTPRNDSEEEGKPEIVTVPEEGDNVITPEDSGPPIDMSDAVFSETYEEELLPGKTAKEVIALSGLPKPLNWKGAEDPVDPDEEEFFPSKALPPEEPLKVLVIEVTGESAGEVIDVAEGTIWDVAKRYEKREGLRFACGLGVRKGQKVGHIWEEKLEPDPLREKRDALPASWVEVMYELTKTRLTEERVGGILEQLLTKARS